jgi:hypothetical protein
MAYASPTAAYFKQLTGINREIEEDDTDASLDVWFADCLPGAEAWVKGLIEKTWVESADRTAEQIALLKDAVCFELASRYMSRATTEGATDTMPPIGIEGLSVIEAGRYYAKRSQQIINVLMGDPYKEIVRRESPA